MPTQHPVEKKAGERRGALGRAAARDVRAISFDVERCIDFAGAPKGGRACCYLGVCRGERGLAMAKKCYFGFSSRSPDESAGTRGRKR
jgi:hypothetical protein